jgi:hypothetical protein
MAEKNFKVDEEIKIVYQAPNKQSGLTITAETILPGDIKDSYFPDQVLIEVLGKGIYTGTFTPNTTGEWQIVVHKPGDEGQVVKRYSVGGHNVDSVGNKADNIKTTVDGIDTQLDTVETKIDNLGTSVGALDTPPMIS